MHGRWWFSWPGEGCSSRGSGGRALPAIFRAAVLPPARFSLRIGLAGDMIDSIAAIRDLGDRASLVGLDCAAAPLFRRRFAKEDSRTATVLESHCARGNWLMEQLSSCASTEGHTTRGDQGHLMLRERIIT